MSITARVLVPNLLSLSLVGLALLYLVIQLGRDRSAMENQVTTVERANRFSSELDQLQRQATVDLISYQYDRDSRHIDDLQSTRAASARALADMKRITVTPKGRMLLADYIESHGASGRLQDEVIEAVNTGDSNAIGRAYRRWSINNRLVRARLNDLYTYKTLTLERLLDETDLRRRRLSVGVGLLTAFAFGAMVLSSLFYGRVVARPIRRLTEVARRIAAGDVASRIDVPRRGDEIHALAQAFNAMTDQLVSANTELERKVDERTAELAESNISLRHEIAERQRIQEALVQAERLAAIGQMITGLSHESRNALQRSLACLEMLRRRVGDDERVQFLLREARLAQEELQQVYEGVRDYAGPINLQRTQSDLGEIWRSTWEQLETVRTGRDATLTELAYGLDLTCEADPFRMGQAFRNLLENSLAATTDPVRIAIEAGDGELEGRPALRVVVRDNGPGLEPDQVGRIFEPFYTTKTKGTGLGMSIVRRIIEAHGGLVYILPDTVPGLAVELLLPRTVR